MPTLQGVKFRLKRIQDALTKPFSEMTVVPMGNEGVFDFLAPLIPELPTVPEELKQAALPDDQAAQVIESSEPEVSRTLYVMARLLRARKIAEVGVFRGATSRFLARALQDNGGGELFLVDMSEDALKAAESMVGDAPGVNLRNLLGSSTAEEVLAAVPPDLDLVYLDADHTEAGVRAELAKWIPRIRSGGIVAVHDSVGISGVCKAVVEYAGSHTLLTMSTQRGCGFSMIRV